VEDPRDLSDHHVVGPGLLHGAEHRERVEADRVVGGERPGVLVGVVVPEPLLHATDRARADLLGRGPEPVDRVLIASRGHEHHRRTA
jgi:hypothetical protein